MSRIGKTLLLVALSTLPATASAQSRSEFRSALEDCISFASLKGFIEKAQMDGIYVVTMSCTEGPARDLYSEAGKAGIAETAVQLVDRERALIRKFGKSTCGQVTESAGGEPKRGFTCRIVLDVGDVALRAY